MDSLEEKDDLLKEIEHKIKEIDEIITVYGKLKNKTKDGAISEECQGIIDGWRAERTNTDNNPA